MHRCDYISEKQSHIFSELGGIRGRFIDILCNTWNLNTVQKPIKRTRSNLKIKIIFWNKVTCRVSVKIKIIVTEWFTAKIWSKTIRHVSWIWKKFRPKWWFYIKYTKICNTIKNVRYRKIYSSGEDGCKCVG